MLVEKAIGMPAKKYCVIFRNTPFTKIEEMIKAMGFVRYEELARGAIAEYHYYWDDRQLHLRFFQLPDSNDTYGLRAHTEPSIKTNPQWHMERALERDAGDLREKSFYGAGCRKFKAMLRHYKRFYK
jgi:hypothetical protein